MNELAFIVFAALPVSPYILVAAGLVIAVVVLIGAVFLFRSPGKKKAGKANTSSNAPSWQPQNQQQPGGWGAQNSAQQQPGGWGAQNPAQQQPGGWGAQNPAQQPGGWGAPSAQQPGSWGAPAQQPDSWGAQNPAQQQAGGWGTPAQQQSAGGWGTQTPAQQASGWGTTPAQQQPANTWGSPTPNTPSTGTSGGNNQNAWDATFMPQQSAPSAQDAWGKPPSQSAPLQQGASSPWSAPSQPQQQQAQTAYGGGSGQSWGQPNQPAASPDPWNLSAAPQSASAPQGWGQPAQQPAAPASGANPGMPSWQQGPSQGQGFGSGAPGGANPFGSSDNDKTMLRPNNPVGGALGLVRVEEGKEPGRIYEVRKDELSIGRSRESDIFLEDLAVSRLHAKILSLGNGNYALKDEGSANGTKVNGQLVNKYQTYPLQEGDKIQLGQTVLVFAKR
jgi:hypothetical protein